VVFGSKKHGFRAPFWHPKTCVEKPWFGKGKIVIRMHGNVSADTFSCIHGCVRAYVYMYTYARTRTPALRKSETKRKAHIESIHSRFAPMYRFYVCFLLCFTLACLVCAPHQAAAMKGGSPTRGKFFWFGGWCGRTIGQCPPGIGYSKEVKKGVTVRGRTVT